MNKRSMFIVSVITLIFSGCGEEKISPKPEISEQNVNFHSVTPEVVVEDIEEVESLNREIKKPKSRVLQREQPSEKREDFKKGDLYGVGYGSSIEEARTDVLAQLSASISANIHSEFISQNELDDFDSFSKKVHNVTLSTEAPLIGVIFSKPRRDGDIYSIEASIYKEQSNPKYRKQIEFLYGELERDFREAKKYHGDRKVSYLEETLKLYNELHRHLVVANHLDVQNLPEIKIHKTDIKAEIQDSEYDFVVKKEPKKGGFYPQIWLNKEKDVFREGESIEIFAELSRRGCFMVVGYTKKDGELYSYLLELNEEDKLVDKFTTCVDGEESISLGRFSVEPPFGKEYLDIVASKSRFKKSDIKALEPKYDDESGVYFIGAKDRDSFLKGFSRTRALAKKKKFQIDSVKFETRF
jgi:hypothetical protein